MTDLAEVDLPDWKLLADLWQLLLENAAEERSQDIRGSDRRGTFSSAEFDSFRAEAQSREGPLQMIVLDVHSQEQQGGSFRRARVQIWDRAESLGGSFPGVAAVAEVSSGDEVFAKGLTSRMKDFFDAAAARRKQRLEDETAAARRGGAAEATPMQPPLMRASEPTLARRILASNWTITIVGGVVATLVAVLVVALVT